VSSERKSGVVLPVSSLPGPYGIGTFGAEARRFIDFLADAGQSYWQVLPLGPTGFGDSPYQSCSAMAGNPYFIDLPLLCEQGLLAPDELAAFDFGDDPDRVDYGALYRARLRALRLAFARRRPLVRALRSFRAAQADWLPDYALFMAVKTHFGMAGLDDWPDTSIRARAPAALRRYRAALAEDIAFYEFLQYLFDTQWAALKAYADERRIRIVGDLPIYVSRDSVELWTRPELFQTRRDGRPRDVAGVPPDYYSETGQLWGNPLYDWRHHEQTGWAWWLRRLGHTRKFFDVIRIDHFRGFYNYWAVPAGAETALHGRWRRGPGLKLIRAIRAAYPDLPLIAEDLGDLDDTVRAFFAKTGLPGMDVLVYAFDPNGDSSYLPHNTRPNRVFYTSTHDAPPFLDWLTGEASDAQRAMAFAYLRLREDEGLSWGAVKAVWGSAAGLAMAPLQDILGLGADARINTPSTLGGGNWRWRVRAEALNDEVAARLRAVTHIYRRL
jgi:4-alpha-glucanotransferase